MIAGPDLDRLDFERGGGYVTVVTQDAVTGAVLMTARADHAAIRRILETGEMHYHSRTRGPWHKGATSGNTQRVVSLHADCDGDAVLALVVPAGPSCHAGTTTCFGDDAPSGALRQLDQRVARRALGAPAGSYTRALLDDRNLRLKKIGEEAAELAIACADGDKAGAIAEAADLVYHILVALRAVGAGIDDVTQALALRSR